MTASTPASSPSQGFVATVRTFPRSFWMGCTIEMWERLAYYGVRKVVPIYIAQASDPAGLHFTQGEKGSIFAWWALVQSLVPMVSGGFADRFGYKRTIATSVTLACTGYVLMATQRSYAGFLAACLVLAVGTGIFKPGIQGTIAQSTSKSNSSVGWGLFYWVVNVGAAFAPALGGFLRLKSWPLVFYGSAVAMAINYAMLFTYPEVSSGADTTKTARRVLIDTLRNLLDLRLLVVIVLFSGFWMMQFQLTDFMPNFYSDWIDSTSFVKSNTWLPKSWLIADPRGLQLKQENALNINSILIVGFVIPISYLVAKMRVMSAISSGVVIATVGTVLFAVSPSVYVLFASITLFSLGEMLTGPKKSEYFSLIAPTGKKALYLGYVNIPLAIGQAAGAKLVGWHYGQFGEKATLSLRYLAEHTSAHSPGAWNGDPETLPSFVGVSRADAFHALCNKLGLDAGAASHLLWTTYQPYQIWYLLAGVGFASLVGIMIFSKASKRWADLNV